MSEEAGIQIEFLSGPRDGEIDSFRSTSIEFGREQGVHVQLSFDRMVSRRHAKIHRQGDRFEVEDLGSSFGTLVDGKRIGGKQTISPESIVTFGHTEIKVGPPDPNAKAKTAEAAQESEA